MAKLTINQTQQALVRYIQPDSNCSDQNAGRQLGYPAHIGVNAKRAGLPASGPGRKISKLDASGIVTPKQEARNE